MFKAIAPEIVLSPLTPVSRAFHDVADDADDTDDFTSYDNTAIDWTLSTRRSSERHLLRLQLLCQPFVDAEVPV